MKVLDLVRVFLASTAGMMLALASAVFLSGSTSHEDIHTAWLLAGASVVILSLVSARKHV